MTEVCDHCGDWYREGETHECQMKPEPASKVVSLVERRPPKPNNRAWTAEEMLVELLEEMRSGKTVPVNMMLFFMTKEPDGAYRPNTWRQNLTIAEMIAYHQLGITKAIEEWRVS